MTFIQTPKAADVLCGKDKTFGKHPGNMLYRDLIEARALDYAAAIYKLDKMKLTTEIVATMVTEFGTRFLRPVGFPNITTGITTTSSSSTSINNISSEAIENDGGITGTSSNGTGCTSVSNTAPLAITSDGNKTTDMVGWEEISLTAARDKTSHALRFCAANTVPNRAAAQLMHQHPMDTTATIIATAPTTSIINIQGDCSSSNNNNTFTINTDGSTHGPPLFLPLLPLAPAASLPTTTAMAVVPTTTAASVPQLPSHSSLIESQLHAATLASAAIAANSTQMQMEISSAGSNVVVSHEDLVQQQTTALQRGIQELIQQKMKQKEQEQQQLEQLENLRRQQQEHQRIQQATLLSSIGDGPTVVVLPPTSPSIGSGTSSPSANTSIANGLRKFKKLPTKSSSTTTNKAKVKIIPTTAELLNSTTTPVRFNRVKVQKSSRKPKMTAQQLQEQKQLLFQQQQQQEQFMGNGMTGQKHNFLSPSQVSPLSSPYGSGQFNQHQQPLIPLQEPLCLPPSSSSSSRKRSNKNNNGTARTISTDMIVLAEAAAVVEAQEARRSAMSRDPQHQK